MSWALKLLLSAYSLLTSHCRLSTCVHRASITLSIMQTKTLIFLHKTLMSPLRVPFEFHGTMDSALLVTIVSWLALFSVLFLYLSKDTEQKACLCDVKLCLPRCHRFSTSGYNNLLQLTPQSCRYICWKMQNRKCTSAIWTSPSLVPFNSTVPEILHFWLSFSL